MNWNQNVPTIDSWTDNMDTTTQCSIENLWSLVKGKKDYVCKYEYKYD